MIFVLLVIGLFVSGVFLFKKVSSGAQGIYKCPLRFWYRQVRLLKWEAEEIKFRPFLLIKSGVYKSAKSEKGFLLGYLENRQVDLIQVEIILLKKGYRKVEAEERNHLVFRRNE